MTDGAGSSSGGSSYSGGTGGGSSNPMVGTWRSSNGFEITFQSNGKCSINGQGSFNYTYSNGEVTINAGGDSMEGVVSGNKLNIEGDVLTKRS